MRRTRSPCCGACAACGHAAAPPSSVMNARRFIRTPQFAVLWSQITQEYCEVTYQVTPRGLSGGGRRPSIAPGYRTTKHLWNVVSQARVNACSQHSTICSQRADQCWRRLRCKSCSLPTRATNGLISAVAATTRVLLPKPSGIIFPKFELESV